MKNLKFVLIWIISICSSELAFGQINCKQAHHLYDSLHAETFHPVFGAEDPPTYKGGFKELYDLINNKVMQLVLNKQLKTKIYIWFLVDTLGNVQCSRVIQSNNELMNPKVIEIIREIKFIPGRARDKRVVASMILLIRFGLKSRKVDKDD